MIETARTTRSLNMFESPLVKVGLMAPSGAVNQEPLHPRAFGPRQGEQNQNPEAVSDRPSMSPKAKTPKFPQGFHARSSFDVSDGSSVTLCHENNLAVCMLGVKRRFGVFGFVPPEARRADGRAFRRVALPIYKKAA